MKGLRPIMAAQASVRKQMLTGYDCRPVSPVLSNPLNCHSVQGQTINPHSWIGVEYGTGNDSVPGPWIGVEHQ